MMGGQLSDTETCDHRCGNSVGEGLARERPVRAATGQDPDWRWEAGLHHRLAEQRVERPRGRIAQAIDVIAYICRTNSGR